MVASLVVRLALSCSSFCRCGWTLKLHPGGVDEIAIDASGPTKHGARMALPVFGCDRIVSTIRHLRPHASHRFRTK